MKKIRKSKLPICLTRPKNCSKCMCLVTNSDTYGNVSLYFCGVGKTIKKSIKESIIK